MNHVTVVICNYNYEHYPATAIESALAQDYPEMHVFPVPEADIDRYGAGFYTIYGAALVGRVATVRKSLGGYRVRSAGGATVSFANSEQIDKAPEAFNMRWAILRNIANPLARRRVAGR